MNNKEIANLFRVSTVLMEIHDENPFKIRPYSNAAIILENLQDPVSELDPDKIQSIDGIGKGISSTIAEITHTGSFEKYELLKKNTPTGIMEMVTMKGIGPKKIKALWRDYKIENVEQLLIACRNGRVAEMKGFGEKTQEKLRKSLEFRIENRGKLFYSDAEKIAQHIETEIQDKFPECELSFVGALRRKIEVIEVIELLVGFDNLNEIHDYLNVHELFELNAEKSGPFTWCGKWKKNDIRVNIYLCLKSEFFNRLFFQTGSENHLRMLQALGKEDVFSFNFHSVKSEEDIYKVFELNYIPPELREGTFEFKMAQEGAVPALIEMQDLQGTFHNHSTYSDGKNSINEMAKRCIELGYQYLGMADHSKSAFYASGLQEYQVKKQREEIDQLNKDLAPFHIFKGIESDILNDGSLDYEEAVLASFDFIVASIHSNLNMTKQKATHRLLTAIENPYTTFLGHPTGRLLLNREGYPLDHKAIIDACAKNKVIIEINANPWRLDLDWRWVNYALEQGLMLSINPDAHEIDGLQDMYYGVCVGKKGGLTKERTFNALELTEVEKYLNSRKSMIKKG